MSPTTSNFELWNLLSILSVINDVDNVAYVVKNITGHCIHYMSPTTLNFELFFFRWIVDILSARSFYFNFYILFYIYIYIFWGGWAGAHLWATHFMFCFGLFLDLHESHPWGGYLNPRESTDGDFFLLYCGHFFN